MNLYLAENLKKFRMESHFTQEALANQLGVSFQAVSKWERGDSYPDITLLPVIACLFGKSIDELLGFNEAVNEMEITKFIDEFDCLTDGKKANALIREAMKLYPNDFRIIIRYFNCLVAYADESTRMRILPEVQRIYNNIQSHCTVDSIRIKAKRIMAQYYQSLSRIENSGFTVKDAQKIIEELPLMRDGRDYHATLFHYLNPDEHKHACREAIEEELVLLDNTIHHLVYYECKDSVPPCEFRELPDKIAALETMNEIYRKIYTDGNYGQNWLFILYNYGHLGYLYFLTGDSENALKNLRICAELAGEFDALPETTVHSSILLNGKEFHKNTLGSTYSACSHMKRLMLENYPLSEEFKKSNEFRDIIKILKQANPSRT